MSWVRAINVHSSLLKLHSALFAKFLDSVDKQATSEKPMIGGKFKYQWITKVDDDTEGWHLIAKLDLKDVECHAYAYESKKELQQDCFENLLCAICGQSYSLGGFEEFETLVSLVDYYRCLPVLSQSINALQNTSIDADFVSRRSSDVMVLAVNLRHKLLFTKALIYAVTDGGRDEVCRKRLKRSMRNITPAIPFTGQFSKMDHGTLIDSKLQAILNSHLQFRSHLKAEETSEKGNFFCVKIADEDLPVG
ncbi:hypothetical protein BKA65DRAFT_482956 [Rhexocercosporidium sp. MPI-PUGE-AT-0058]|nr:hypothetical protein BKA65DRAFT_482956 [Rhexocercosporidium sp. MPI-PUGE-AT-0058]